MAFRKLIAVGLMSMQTANVPVYAYARSYMRGGGVSPAQSFLKHSLVPLEAIATHLPERGVIWDLGCGEGILTNLVARAKPDCTVIGFDRDAERLEIARRNAAPNASFEVGDIFELPDRGPIDGVIMNDVVHHQPFVRQPVLLMDALKRLRPGGALVLKEVDQTDKPDRMMTQFFDSRLYPDDPLCFRAKDDWLALLARLGARDVKAVRIRHPWPASRTLFLARRPDDAALYSEQEMVYSVIAENEAAARAGAATVFMTGATGFIGRHLARKLLRDGLAGQPVRLLVLARRPDRVDADLLATGAVAVPGDLSDLQRLARIFQGVDYVFHLAAEVKLTKGADLWRNNYHGTVDLLNACAGTGLKRFVHASTMGAVDRAPGDPCTTPLDETSPAHPLSEYGETKLRAEEAVRESGLPYSIIRVPWGYGAGMTPDTHVRFLTQGVGDGKPFSFIDFPGRVSICAIDDLVDAFIMASERDDMLNDVYFVSDGRPLSLGDLFRRAGSVIGRRAAFIPVPKPAAALARAVRRYLPLQLQNLNSDVLCVSNAKIVGRGFRPKTPQRQGFANLAQDLGLIPMTDRLLVSILTGAASGIGQALAEAMTREGHRLLLIDRNEAALADVADRFGADRLALDLTDDGAIAEIEKYVDEGRYQLDWVVNCAGIGVRGDVTDLDRKRQDDVLRVNVSALAGLSRLALQHFRKVGRGVLINVGSTAGFQPMPHMAAYAASKAFVQNYTRSLVGEMKDLPGVVILLANPTGSATGFQQAAGVKTMAGEKLMPAEVVAERIIDAAYARKHEITLGLKGQGMSLVARLLPMNLQIDLWSKLMKSMR